MRKPDQTDGSPARVVLARTYIPLKGGGPTPPLGLMYLSARAKEKFGARIEVELFDSGIIGADGLIDQLSAAGASVVGISALSCEKDIAIRAARGAKKNGAIVVVGGPLASSTGEALLEIDEIDLVVIGEGEETFCELLENIIDGGATKEIDGTIYRDEGKIVRAPARAAIEDLDGLPNPDWSLIDPRAYGRQVSFAGAASRPLYMPIQTSRGCPYRCYFCHNIFGKSVRLRSPESIYAEISALFDNYGIDEVHFFDDVFNVDRERVHRFCQLVIDSGRRFYFAFPNGLRADIIDEETIDILRRAGTYKINFGFETVSERLQKVIGKNLDIERAKEAIRLSSNAGIITGAYFILGFPDQTEAEMEQTVDYAAASPLDLAYFFKAAAYPETEMARSITGVGEADRESDLHFYSMARAYGPVGPKRLNALMLRAERKFFLKPARLWRLFKKTDSKTIFARNILTLFVSLLLGLLFEKLIFAEEAKSDEAN